MKKVIIIISILFTFLLLITFGYSYWIIMNSIEAINPSYVGFPNDLQLEYNNIYTYNNSIQYPKTNLDGYTTNYEYKLIDDSNWTTISETEGPVNAGEYDLYVTATNNSTGDKLYSQVKVIIEPVKLKADYIEISYNDVGSRNRTATLFADYIYDNNLIKLRDSNDDISNIQFPPFAMSNGMYEYDFTENTNVAGSTYLLQIKSTSANYAIYDYQTKTYKTTGNTILKYKTAYTTVGGESDTLCTIEDAILNGTGDISFVGDATDTTSYVETSFCALDSSVNPYSTNNIYTLSDRLLYVNYSNTIKTTGYETKEATATGNVYSALIVPSSTTLYLSGSSTLLVGSVISYIQPKTSISCNRGVVMNDGSIIVESGSSIISYGYIKSSSLSTGEIILKNGSSCQDVMTTYDWLGGTTTTNVLSKNVIPMNAWSLHNISCNTKIYSGAEYKGFIYVDMGTEVAIPFYVIVPSGHENASECLFVANNSTSETEYIEKTVSYGQYTGYSSTYADNAALHNITGLNQIVGVKDLLKVNGSYTDSTLTLSVSGQTISTSLEKSCPLGFAEIVIETNSNMELSKSDYLFLPGTTLTIEEGATLTIGKSVDLSFETWDHVSAVTPANTSWCFKTYCKDQYDARMVLNGTFISNGNVGGQICSTNPQATLDLSNSGLSSSFSSMYYAVGASGLISTNDVGYTVTGLKVYGLINGQNYNSSFSKLLYQTSESYTSEGYYYWNNANHITYDTASLTGIQNKSGIQIGGTSCIPSGTLITMADGSQKKIEDVTADDMLLVFNHETGKFEPSKILVIEYDGWTDFEIINLEFSNGTTTRLIYEHGYFNKTLNKYVYITSDNYKEYIGHEFIYYNGSCFEEVILNNSYITYEYVGCYSPVTVYHFNFFADGMLSMPGGIEGLFNFFEYDDTLKYDEELMLLDIEQYGLLPYEVFKDIMPYEMYEMLPAKYMNIAINKGMITFDDILAYIKRYLEGNDIL